MGGTGLLIPAPYTGTSSRDAHLHRDPPSSEPGTDYYMDIGTPLRAPARCRVVQTGGSVVPATGRYTILDDGYRWLRYLHQSEWWVRTGQELDVGDIFGLSGASGYGSEYFGADGMDDFPWWETGGPHVHVTAFRGRALTLGASGTVDFHALTGGQVAGGGSSSFIPRVIIPERHSDMEFIAITEPAEVARGGIDGNGIAGWAILNTSKPNHRHNPIIIRATDPNAQETANGYARSFGRSAQQVKRQDWENLLEANRLTNLVPST